MQEGFVRSAGYQLAQWTAAYPSPATTDSLESLFLISRSSLGESLVRVATLSDFVAYPVNELKYFECRGTGGNALFSALAGDVIRVTPSPDHWLQSGEPYDDCDFTVASLVSTSGSTPLIKVGNYLQLDDYSFTDEDQGRWFLLAGFDTSGYNAPVQVVDVLTPHTARIAFASALSVTTNETGTAWTKRRLLIDTNAGALLEPRYFPTLESAVGWELLRTGTSYGTGAFGETSRTTPGALVFRDRRFTSMLPSLDAALAVASNTRAAVALLQAEADSNNTAFLGVTQTDYP